MSSFQKANLMQRISEKIEEMEEQMQKNNDEIKENDEIGQNLNTLMQNNATEQELNKFKLFTGELEKIVPLILSLIQRLNRYELSLQELEISSEGNEEKKQALREKIQKVKDQQEEASYLRDVNDKRADVISYFLEKYCTDEELADFQHYIEMKYQLALMQNELSEKIKLGNERLKELEETEIE